VPGRVVDGVGGFAHEGTEAFEVGVGGVVAEPGGGHRRDEAWWDLQRGGDTGGERDVLADADHVAGVARDLHRLREGRGGDDEKVVDSADGGLPA
jgi:hypothetical protein